MKTKKEILIVTISYFPISCYSSACNCLDEFCEKMFGRYSYERTHRAYGYVSPYYSGHYFKTHKTKEEINSYIKKFLESYSVNDCQSTP